MHEEQSVVISTTDERFESDVTVRSQQGLVIVDFWAEWCAPCRALTPVLEKLADEFQGQLTLVKANTEQNIQACRQFGVAGIPAVFAVLEQQTINSFQGALPEAEVRNWLENCLQLQRLFQARQLIDSNSEEAEKQLRELLDQSGSDQARVALVELLHAQRRDDECRVELEQLAARGFLEPECERIQSALDLNKFASDDTEPLRSEAASAPDDLELQLRLAEGLAANRQFEEAFKICLPLIERDRQQTGEKARQLMVDSFRVLGNDQELTRDYRRKLSMLLY